MEDGTLLTQALSRIFSPIFKLFRYFTWWTLWMPFVVCFFILIRLFHRYELSTELGRHLGWSYDLIWDGNDWPSALELNYILVNLFSLLWVIILPIIVGECMI